MRTLLQNGLFCWRTLWLFACIGSVNLARADVAGPDSPLAAELRAEFAALEPQLSSNQFNLPLYLDSAESSNRSKGDIYALVGPAHWCDVLILHLNAKYGHASAHNASNVLAVSIGKTFLHLTYSYAFDFQGRLAMLAYLSILGRGKVGFTHTAKPSSGQPDYIGGVRGAVERNTMRYHLAIDTACGTTRKTPAKLVYRHRAIFPATA